MFIIDLIKKVNEYLKGLFVKKKDIVYLILRLNHTNGY
ncbi:epsilon family phenol-soluble modulin, partial [Staphylococcus pseudintermedius]